jgi:putative flippase GtrA
MKNMASHWWYVPEKLRFLAAGAYNTAFGYAAFSALYWLLSPRVNYLAIALTAYVVSVISAYAVYRWLVFRAMDSFLASFLRFNMSQLTALGCGMTGLYVFVQVGHLHPLIAQALVLMLTLLITFALHSRYSFKYHLGQTIDRAPGARRPYRSREK